MTDHEVASWPPLTAVVQADGSATVSIAGRQHALARADSVDDARAAALNYIGHTADELRRPVRVEAHDPDGQWAIIVHPLHEGQEERRLEEIAGEPAPTTARKLRLPVIRPPAPDPADPVRRHTGRQTVSTEPPSSSPVAVAPSVVEAAALAEDGTIASVTDITVSREAAGPIHHMDGPDPNTPAGDMAEVPRKRLTVEALLTPQSEVQAPAAHGVRGALNRLGLRLYPGAIEQSRRADVRAVCTTFPGPRTIVVVNPKGGANKTPTTLLLAAAFARRRGGSVLAWDNNETRGTGGWRSHASHHDATALDLLRDATTFQAAGRLGDLDAYVHHQPDDTHDVLRSDDDPAGRHIMSGDDVRTVHTIAARYYRLILIDTGNNHLAPNYLAGLDLADQLVVATTTKEDHTASAAWLLQALHLRGGHHSQLAEHAVAVVSHATPGRDPNTPRILDEFDGAFTATVTIPYDPAMRSGPLHWASLNPTTQHAWTHAAAAVAQSLAAQEQPR